MHTLHLALLAASVGCLVVTAVAGPALARIDAHLPMLGVVVGGALALGNAASLLPEVPAWYSATLVVATIAGVAWLASSVAATRGRRGAGAREAAATTVGGITPTSVAHGPALALVPVAVTGPVRTGTPERPDVHVVTPATFQAQGPSDGWATTGQDPYVAAHIERYVDARATRRAHGSHGPRRHDGTDPTARFLALARAYGVERPPREIGRGRHL